MATTIPIRKIDRIGTQTIVSWETPSGPLTTRHFERLFADEDFARVRPEPGATLRRAQSSPWWNTPSGFAEVGDLFDLGGKLRVVVPRRPVGICPYITLDDPARFSVSGRASASTLSLTRRPAVLDWTPGFEIVNGQLIDQRSGGVSGVDLRSLAGLAVSLGLAATLEDAWLWMPFLVGAVATTGTPTGNNAGAETINVTLDAGSAANRCLTVQISASGESASDVNADPTSVTYDGVAVTKAASIYNNFPNLSAGCWLGYLAGPASGSNTLALNWANEVCFDVGAGGIPLEPVDQTTPLQGTPVTEAVTATTNAIAIASGLTSGAMSVCSVFNSTDTGNLAGASGTTLAWEDWDSGATYNRGGAYKAITGTSVQQDFTGLSTEGSLFVLAAFAETAGGSPQNVTPSAIGSSEAFGTARVRHTVTPSAIASAEALGEPQLNLRVLAGGITSGETFGTAKLNLRIFPSSIDSAEALGEPTVKIIQPIQASGIGSAEAVGTPQLNLRMLMTALASGETFGSTRLQHTVQPSGIESAEALGTPQLNLRVLAAALASGEAFGVTRFNLRIFPDGTASGEAFGAAAVLQPQTVRPDGVASAEALGTATLNLRLTPGGIASGEVFGAALLYFPALLEPLVVVAADSRTYDLIATARTFEFVVSDRIYTVTVADRVYDVSAASH